MTEKRRLSLQHRRILLGVSTAALLLVGCPDCPNPTLYTVGGTVTGLAGRPGLELRNDGAGTLTITHDGPFTFDGGFPSGDSYSVTISNGSTTPTRTCTVANATGTVTDAAVANVEVTCVTNTYSAINYYARDQAWLVFWNDWPETKNAMSVDMPGIYDLGANTVRLFIHPAAFGWPSSPTSVQLDRIEEALGILQQNGLKARLCLFDLFADYSMKDESVAWMTPLMNHFRDDPRIAMWELKNEVNMFTGAGVPDAQVTDWVAYVFPVFKGLASNIPASISISAASNYQDVWRSNLRALVDSGTPPDYYDVHFYIRDDLLWTTPIEADIHDAVAIVGDAGILLLHELGQPTSGYYAEEAQRDVLQTVFHDGWAAGIRSFGVWTYTDFSDGTIVDGPPLEAGSKELEYGLHRLDGGVKPAVAVVSNMFQGIPPASPAPPMLYNGSFEVASERGTPMLKAWVPWIQSEGWYKGELVRDASRSRTGASSARLTTRAGDSTGFFHVPGWHVTPGQTVSAQGYAWVDELPAGSQVHLTISWLRASASDWIANSDGAAAASDGGWTPLSVTGTAPAEAQYMQIFAKAECPESNRYVWFDDFTATFP